MAWTSKFVTPTGGGDHSGSSEANALTLTEAAALAGSNLSFEVKAGTYALGSTLLQLNIAGPRRWRGYKVTPGDLDGEPAGPRVPGTDLPWWQFTDGVVPINGAQQQLSNLVITTARASAACGITGEQVRLDRVRIENTGTTVDSVALYAAAVNWCASRCWFQAVAPANVVRVDQPGYLVGCAIRGGNHGVALNSGALLLHCTFDDQAGHGVFLNSVEAVRSQTAIVGCTVYSAGLNGISLTALNELSSGVLIADCLLGQNAFYGIASGLTAFRTHRTNNDFYLNSAGKEEGFGDNPSFAEQVETAQPFVNAPGHDFTLVSTAKARGAGCPRKFEAETYESFLDIGAVQERCMTPTEVADAVWNPARASYNVAGSMGAAQGDVQTWRGAQPSPLSGSLVQVWIAPGNIGTGAVSANAIANGAFTAPKFAADFLTAAGLAADAVAEIQAGLSTLDAAGVRGAVGLATANLDDQLTTINSNVVNGYGDVQARLPATLDGGLMRCAVQTAAPGSLDASAFTLDALAEFADSVWDEVLAEHLLTGSTGEALSDAAAGGGGGGATPAAIADAVWDELLAGHSAAGSAGLVLSAAGSAGDPWVTLLPGGYPTGSAGQILGTRLDVAVGTRLATAAYVLPPTVGDIQAGLATAAALGAVQTDVDTLQSDLGEVNAAVGEVQADTDNIQTRLPAALVGGRLPADVTGQQIGLTPAAVDAILDEVIEGPFTLRQILRVLFGSQAGKTNGALGPTFSIRDVMDTKNRVQAQVDLEGNRLSVVIDGS